MRNSLAAKAARYSLAHNPDCGKCANCLEVEQLKRQYDFEKTYFIKGQANRTEVNKARHAWLEASRTKRCSKGVID